MLLGEKSALLDTTSHSRQSLSVQYSTVQHTTLPFDPDSSPLITLHYYYLAPRSKKHRRQYYYLRRKSYAREAGT